MLSALPARERRRLDPQLEEVEHGLREVIHDGGKPIRYVYFPVTAVSSLVLAMRDGSAVEIASVGNEGMLGTPVFLGTDRGPSGATAQIPGLSLRMRASVFREEMLRAGPLHSIVQRYTLALIQQISQSVACNNLHSVEQRMCRWLLMIHDRLGGAQFPLTQDLLAEILGVRRASVSAIAGALQEQGTIRYHRGQLRIAERRRLEACACECYRAIRHEFDRLLD